MKSNELKAAFDQQAAGYDQHWARLAPIRESLHFLLEAVFAELPEDARILSVGVGTGAELGHLAKRFARARFIAVEPSPAMLNLCRERARQEGFFSRCEFHEGYVETLPGGEPCHAATSLLVSQFILDRQARVDFFRAIAARLIPAGILATSDLASEVGTAQHEALVGAWMNMMAGAGIAPEARAKMREAWRKDVAILPPAEVASLIEAGGFDVPTRFHQAGLIHAWFARRRA